MHNPRLLLLDEPYRGFDWETYPRFWDLAKSLRESGCSVLVVSHLAYDTDRLDAVPHESPTPRHRSASEGGQSVNPSFTASKTGR